jgi:hypothetical protein
MPARALSAGSGRDATSAHLSPMLPFDALPAVVDVMRTVWPINLHGSAAPGESPLGSVTDVSLLDASNHTRGDLPLPPSPVNASFPGGSLPVHFLVPVEQGECLRVLPAVCMEAASVTWSLVLQHARCPEMMWGG